MNYYTDYYGYDETIAESESFNEYVELSTSESVDEEWFESFEF